MNKNNKTVISIVIPTYNAEKFIDACITSIISQSFELFEIIIVNDGSTDNSKLIADKWSQIDTRIRVIHKTNEGVTIARKTGMEKAIGEWILFVDSDDTLPVNALSILAAHIRADIDMIYGCVNRVGSKQISYSEFGEKNTNEYLKILLQRREYWAPFARLIRKNTFDKFTFDIPPQIIIGEDFIMNIRLAQNYRRVILLPEVVYNYIYQPQSAMSKLSSLDGNYRKLYAHVFKESFSKDFKNILRYDIMGFQIRRQYNFYKMKIKNILKL